MTYSQINPTKVGGFPTRHRKRWSMLEALTMGFLANPDFHNCSLPEIAHCLKRTESALIKMRRKLNATDNWDIAEFRMEVKPNSSHD